MQGNNCILDANAVLRFLLQDNEEQFRQILYRNTPFFIKFLRYEITHNLAPPQTLQKYFT